MKNELDPDRLATTDADGHRVYLYPEDVSGKWYQRRQIFYWFLIVIYLVIPWIYIGGKPAIQLDIFNREFTLVGYTWHGVEPIFIFLMMISTVFFVGFMTSLYGRVWCGWACPQTVFIQSIFMKIEQFIEGGARARRELDFAPMSFSKFARKLSKWTIFTVIALHIAHTFAGYILGPRELFAMTMHSPFENLGVFTAIMIFTSIILLDFGWFREQFCIIACPYGRMQSVMMDTNSLIVAYDKKRGEPRRLTAPREAEGDCINCNHCVKVCPTGIDIRRGTQLECIACTNCIDACDEIMTKINKPHGLIRYTTELELEGGVRKKITARSIIYICISLFFLSVLLIFISNSGSLNVQLYRGAESPFQVSKNADGSSLIINHFTFKVTHQGSTRHEINIVPHDPNYSSMIKIVSLKNPLVIDKNELKIPLFIKFSPQILVQGQKMVNFDIVEDGKIIKSFDAPLVGPAL